MGPETVSALLDTLYQRRLTVFLVVAGAALGGWFFVQGAPPLWAARASTFVPTDVPRLSLSSEEANVPEGPVLPDASETTRIGLVGLMSSPAIFERVAETMPGADPKDLRKQVIIDIDKNQHLSVVVSDPSRERAVELANACIRAFRDEMRDMAERAPRATLAALEAEEPNAWGAYYAAQDALVAYLDSIESADPEVDLKLIVEERQRLAEQLQQLAVDERKSAVQRPVIEEQLGERDEFILSRRTLVQNPRYREALGKLGDLRVELAVERLRYEEAHPAIERLAERIASAEQQVLLEAEDVLILGSEEYQEDPRTRKLLDELVDFDMQAAGRIATREVLERRLADLEPQLARIPINRSEMARLSTGIQQAKSHAERVSKRVEELRLQLRRRIDFTFLDESRLARVDDTRQLPGLAGVMIFSSLGGLLVGFVLSLLLELVAQARMRRPF